MENIVFFYIMIVLLKFQFLSKLWKIYHDNDTSIKIRKKFEHHCPIYDLSIATCAADVRARL